MGKPVAFEASAEERDTRGFISMTSSRPESGWTANWMLEPPVSTPIARMTVMAASRISWYSRSVSVWAGATVIESPVWIPIGSKFSMEQTMTTLSARSRITSSSNSFQPRTDSSMEIWPIIERSRPSFAIRSNSSALYATPPPVPPSVKLGRMTTGKPIVCAMSRASSGVRA